MKRRSFLKSIGAVFAAPLMPVPSLAFGSVTPMVSADTYRWAETIARAHSYCNTAMLQRHLNLDLSTATALKSQLVKNGIISAQANQFGIHKATKPLFEGAFPKPHVSTQPGRAALCESVEQQEVPDIQCAHQSDGQECAYCGEYEIERNLASIVQKIGRQEAFV